MTLHQILDIGTAALSFLAVGAGLAAARTLFRVGKNLEDA